MNDNNQNIRLFTIEATYRAPVFIHRSVLAGSLDEACRLVLEHEDWESATTDYESPGPTYISGAWEGGRAYAEGAELIVPDRYSREDDGISIPPPPAPWPDRRAPWWRRALAWVVPLALCRRLGWEG